MDQRLFGIMDMVMVVIPAAGFGVWQLISINREIAKDRAAKASDAASPDDARHTIRQHRLDDR